jgi:hypothetical protein
MKYIDAEKLKAELTKLQFTLNASYRKPQSDNIVRAISLEYDDILSIVGSLQQEQPSLPSNLDEAAHNHAANNGGRWLTDDVGIKCFAFNPQEVKDAFKAGAEWMAGQGVKADFEVCKLANRAWLTAIDEKKFAQDVFDNFAAGDKVVVQIRKK